MMSRLMQRAEDRAHRRQRSRVSELAKQLKAMLGEAVVEAEDGRVVVRGRGILRRWLTDPRLRFLAGGCE